MIHSFHSKYKVLIFWIFAQVMLDQYITILKIGGYSLIILLDKQ